MTLVELIHFLPYALPALVVLVLAPPGASSRAIDVVGPGEETMDACAKPPCRAARPGTFAPARSRPGPDGDERLEAMLSHQLVDETRWGGARAHAAR